MTLIYRLLRKGIAMRRVTLRYCHVENEDNGCEGWGESDNQSVPVHAKLLRLLVHTVLGLLPPVWSMCFICVGS
ncbi:hypothetical protein I7I48_00053 [Histoplasma ohiense]|nr:hypothetical protein I7I48_00053 [Histoplasma ohiense (nom. inval.)]